jgi:hypothetical protein
MIYYTLHAQSALAKRHLDRSLVEQILAAPSWIEADKVDPELERAFGRSSPGTQWIRVVFRKLPNGDMLVVTVHPDRDAVAQV